ncbi:hypothetical protein BJX62DRAFT_234826 [Aspergillus germanicus]
MPPSISLDSLPTELHITIIRHLDPIALIALSQTNTYYRALITPRKPQFIERLLALECDERYGGPAITFTRFGKPVPDCESAEWEANRWACTSCLRLRPHYAFTNQSLLRLAYRKPPAGPKGWAVTSWEPTGKRRREKTAQKKKKKKGKDKDEDDKDAILDFRLVAEDLNLELSAHPHSDEERQLRKRTGILMSGNWGISRANDNLATRLARFQDSGMASFAEMTLSQFSELSEEEEATFLEKESQVLHLLRAGTNRHQRRCIQCRFRRNEFNDPNRDNSDGGLSGKDRIGSDDITILPGRQITLDTSIGRYFPGVCDALQHKRPAGIRPGSEFRIGRMDTSDASWTMYKLRCPRCETWKEIRAFRFGAAYPMWRPDAADGKNYIYCTWDKRDVTSAYLQCNHCFAADSAGGGCNALGQELVRWLENLLDNELRIVQATLAYLFGTAFQNAGSLGYDVRSDMMPTVTHARAVRFTRDDVVTIRERWEQWMANDNIAAGVHAHGNPLRRWVEQYADAEAMWYWLEGCLEELSGDGIRDVLVDWALNRDKPVQC